MIQLKTVMTHVKHSRTFRTVMLKYCFISIFLFLSHPSTYFIFHAAAILLVIRNDLRLQIYYRKLVFLII